MYVVPSGRNEVVFCKCRKEANQKSKLKFLNMPVKFKENTISNLNHTLYTSMTDKLLVKRNKNDCAEFVKNIKDFDKGLYIFSETKGSGKTHLATAIGNALTKHFGIRCKYSTTLNILDAIKETYNDDALTSKKKLLFDIQTTEILILDDIGVESPTSHTEEVLYSIINERIANNKLTIYTSNLKIDDLKLSERITNRINGSTYKINMPEESIRSKLAPKENGGELRKKIKILEETN